MVKLQPAIGERRRGSEGLRGCHHKQDEDLAYNAHDQLDRADNACQKVMR